MSPHVRIWSYGPAGALVLAGVICAALVPGLAGQLLALVLVSTGLVGAVLLVFYEVGVGEDREREREQARARPRETRPAQPVLPRRRTPRFRRRPG